MRKIILCLDGTWNDLVSALRADFDIDIMQFSTKDMFVRDCFEDFFDKLELIAHYINIELINEEDVSVTLSYYAKLIMRNYGIFEPFLLGYGYERANDLIIKISK